MKNQQQCYRNIERLPHVRIHSLCADKYLLCRMVSLRKSIISQRGQHDTIAGPGSPDFPFVFFLSLTYFSLSCFHLLSHSSGLASTSICIIPQIPLVISSSLFTLFIITLLQLHPAHLQYTYQSYRFPGIFLSNILVCPAAHPPKTRKTSHCFYKSFVIHFTILADSAEIT